MDARPLLRAIVLMAAATSLGASYRTANFVVTAPTSTLAQKIGTAGEQYRRNLAIAWLGRELPRWSSPCPITARVANHLGAGGATSFVFQNGQVGGWRMTIQGSEVRILDSVLPHEITHTIFATHFRQPLPRWADEGACTTIEHVSERARHQKMLVQFLLTDRGIAFSRMFAMKEYPRDVLPLYAQGYSLARFFIEQGGRRKFVKFVESGLRDSNWIRAVDESYGFDNLAILQDQWLSWVRRGSPSLVPASPAPDQPKVLLAANQKRTRPEPNLIHRVMRGEKSGDAVGATTPTAARPAATTTAPKSQPMVAATGRGWRPAGSRSATPPAAVAAAPPAPNRHQAVRQQPMQRPKQQVLR